MKYKAIIFDLDGTVVPSILKGMPSPAVIESALKVKNRLKLSTASARAVQYCRDIWSALSIDDPCIVNGGSQIIKPNTEEILWEQSLPVGVIEAVLKESEGYADTFAFNGVILRTKDIAMFPKKTNLMVVFGVKKNMSEDLVKKLSTISDVEVHILHSWVEGDYWDIHVIHKLATKKHAIEKLIEVLGLTKEEVIGVGDGNNDLPLFESVGYKVAMGNAVEPLKKAADHITDTLTNDGFAKFIEEKLLKNQL